MLRTLMVALATASISTTAFADGHLGGGDPEAGAKAFNKCKSCHMIVADDDEVIVKGGRTGPNLYGVIGRTAGSYDGFRYGPSIVTAGEGGLVWDQASFSAYVPDPAGFLKETLGDSKARAKMAKQRVDEEALADLYAFLVSVGPEAPATN